MFCQEKTRRTKGAHSQRTRVRPGHPWPDLAAWLKLQEGIGGKLVNQHSKSSGSRKAVYRSTASQSSVNAGRSCI